MSSSKKLKGLLDQSGPQYRDAIEKIIENLETLIFTPREAIIYLFLLNNGPSRCQQLHSSLEFDRQSLYTVLRQLERCGALSKVISKPNLYIATPLRELLNLVITEKTNELKQFEALKTSTIGLWKTLPQAEESQGKNAFVVQVQQESLRNKLETEIKNSEHRVYYLRKQDYGYVYDLIPETDHVETNNTRVTSFIILDDKLYIIHGDSYEKQLINFTSPGIVAAFTTLYNKLVASK